MVRCILSVVTNSPVLLDKPEGVTTTTSAAQNTAIQGQTVTLTCHVTAADPPVSEYRFYRNDSNTALNKLTNINQYTINGVQRARDYGKYKCVAKNSAGEGRSDAVVLNINGKKTKIKKILYNFISSIMAGEFLGEC